MSWLWRALYGNISHLTPNQSWGSVSLSVPSQVGSLEILQSGQGPARGVYLGKDEWHRGEMTTQAEGEARPGSGGSALGSMREVRKFGQRAFEASLTAGARSGRMRDVLGEGTGPGCGVVVAAVTQRGQGTPGPLGQPPP